MVTVGVKLDLVDNINLLAKSAVKYDFDIDVKCGKYLVNAKSILGIMSIASSEVMELRVETSVDSAKPFLDEIKCMLAGELAQG